MALDANEPVSLADAKAFCRVDTDDDNLTLELLIVAAREWVEGRIGQIFLPREVTDVFADFEADLVLSKWPVDAASVTIDYVDGDGYDQGFDDFVVLAANRPASLALDTDASWPTVSSLGQAVTVTYDAGYDPYTDVPDAIRLAILMIVSARYDNRGGVSDKSFDEVPLGVEEMLRRHRPIAVA